MFFLASLCSCTAMENPKDNSSARIDSIANARVDSIKNSLKLKNDSAINAMAAQKAKEMKINK